MILRIHDIRVQMAAVLKILPKMVGMFMEGLTPIAEGTQEFCKNIYMVKLLILEWMQH